MSNPWDCPECGSDRPGNHKRGCPGFERLVAARHAQQPDHGISPAQLREKVQALEKRIDDVASVAASVSGDYDHVCDRLDAALKRIELLERDMSDVQLSGDKP